MTKRPIGHQDEQYGVFSENLSENTRDEDDVDAAGEEEGCRRRRRRA